MTPKGDKMEVKVVCSIHVDFAVYESVRDKIMFKILEINEKIKRPFLRHPTSGMAFLILLRASNIRRRTEVNENQHSKSSWLR